MDEQYRKLLLRLTLADVLEMHVQGCGKSWAEIGRDVGWTDAVVNRIRELTDDYWPSSAKLVDFCVATRSMILADWIRVHVGARLADPTCGPVSDDAACLESRELLSHVGQMLGCTGDLAREADIALQDDRLSPKERRRLGKTLLALLSRGADLFKRLGHRRRR